MTTATLIVCLSLGALVEADKPSPTAPGNHLRKLTVDSRERLCRVHVPDSYDPSKPTPLILAFHGAMTNGYILARMSGLDAKSDEAGFIVAYPYGWGLANTSLTWNAGGWGETEGSPRDDVKFVAELLDDLEQSFNIDKRRIFATGLSNGGMMSYRLAAELSERIAAIAPVAGTLTLPEISPSRAVPVIHFHGTEDELVPWNGPPRAAARRLRFRSVQASIDAWVKFNGCREIPVEMSLPDIRDDGTTVIRRVYSGGRDGSQVILFEIQGGGHTWPGKPKPVSFLGRATYDISANDLMWEFFERHPLPEAAGQ